ncbi:glycosyltransferase [Paenibacillus silvisoli]|uniref:glycosyltransferase n=1 Tax=Paenibacillus silvisoli TaxID=3110539 RepID=UPI002804A146|nr:glycosyltransferase [Paenibacillus silvisoli]
MHDLHYQAHERKRFVCETNAPYLFVMYRSAFKQRYPEYIDRMRWLPHFAEPALFRDYGQSKSIDVLMMGCTDRKYYPLRQRMLQKLQGTEGFVYHSHPGYRTFEAASDAWIGAAYAREINRAKLFLSCDSVFRYPLRKYVEVPASRTLLLAPANEDLIELGFIPGTHFISITADDYEEKIRFWLDPRNETAASRIACAGYEFVHENHTTSARAVEFIRTVSAIVRGN